MSAVTSKRQRTNLKSDHRPPKKRKIKRQVDYHSSSSDASDSDSEAEQPVAVGAAPRITKSDSTLLEDDRDDDKDDGKDDGSDNATSSQLDEATSDSELSESDNEGNDADEDDNPNNVKVRKKRNDPTAFANSMSKILNTKLTVSKRADPVLSRSKDASAASKESQDAKLEAKAKQQIREEKRARLERGHTTDILGLQNPDVSTEEIMAREKRYKKLAQQGVIRLFNAVLAAQLKGQEVSRATKKEGVVGMAKRDEKVNEMSKQGFLDLIAGNGKR